jgi:16S rRNA (guanine527-N7)-methyltransferase
MLEVNQVINLTRITQRESAVRMHLLDALMALPELLEAAEGPILDLGSGGGIPGVPLAFATGRETVLLDSVSKKGRAVQGILKSEFPDSRISVSPERAEEHARTCAGRYAAVVARAVAPLPSLVELAAPLLLSGGTLIALKGVPDADELASGRRVAELTGMYEAGVRRTTLPGGEERRTIVSYTKSGASKVRLPRRSGLAQHSPLG